MDIVIDNVGKGGHRMKHVMFYTAIAALFVILFCEKSVVEESVELIELVESIEQTPTGDPLYIHIPDITDSEIETVENLRTQYDSFIYGVSSGPYAFYGLHGEVRGFAAVFCEYLTKLLGIRFVPAILEQSDLMVELNEGYIHFTGTLAPDDTLREAYYMADTIALATQIPELAPIIFIVQKALQGDTAACYLTELHDRGNQDHLNLEFERVAFEEAHAADTAFSVVSAESNDYAARQAAGMGLQWFIGICAVVLFLCAVIFAFVMYIKKRSADNLLKTLTEKYSEELNMHRTLLEQTTMIDRLTGVPNKLFFEHRINTEWRAAIRETKTLSILVISFDTVKSYYEINGQRPGDMLLRTCVRAISQSLRRPYDFLTRREDTVFTVLLPNTDAVGAMKVADTIRENINEQVKIPVSIGINTRIPELGGDQAGFLADADKAMEKAKRFVGNQIVAA